MRWYTSEEAKLGKDDVTVWRFKSVKRYKSGRNRPRLI